MQSSELRELIWQKGQELFRPMPWRDDTRPYYVLVSELMLQQTQVTRVIPKFQAFIAEFADVSALASASLADVIRLWEGLGYNRRAKYLHDAARLIVSEFSGQFPDEASDMLRLPGVGKNTLGALQAYAFNKPSLFVETNIRTVFIHHCFDDQFDIPDTLILSALAEALDAEHPREFYWALMDYGAYLKANGIRNNARSSHYKKQTPLEGSVRQVRGQIINHLRQSDMMVQRLRLLLPADDRFDSALAGLMHDGLVSVTNGRLHLTK